MSRRSTTAVSCLPPPTARSAEDDGETIRRVEEELVADTDDLVPASAELIETAQRRKTAGRRALDHRPAGGAVVEQDAIARVHDVRDANQLRLQRDGVRLHVAAVQLVEIAERRRSGRAIDEHQSIDAVLGGRRCARTQPKSYDRRFQNLHVLCL